MSALMLPGVVLAQTHLSGSTGWLSDKVTYGLSQSGGQPSAVVDLSLRTGGGWTVSTGLASLGGKGRGEAEWSFGAGRGGPLGDTSDWQVSYSRYETLGPTRPDRPGYSQLSVGLAWNERLQVNVLWSLGLGGPDGQGGRTRGRAQIIEASWHQPLGNRLGLNLGLGQVEYGGGLAAASYAYGSVGLSWGLGPVQAFLSRIESASQSPLAARPWALLGVLWNF